MNQIKEYLDVPIQIKRQKYYRTTEACQKIGISRATLYRWLKTGILTKHYKDRRGWRMFTEEDLHKIRAEAQKIKVEYSFPGETNGKTNEGNQ